MTSETIFRPSPRVLRRTLTATAVAVAVATGVSLLAPPQPAGAAIAGARFETPESFADLVARVEPAVVNISTTVAVDRAAFGPAGRDHGGPFGHFRGPFEQFREFFGHVPRPGPDRDGLPSPRSRTQGSGFLVDAQGHIVTNDHVVVGAREITVTLSDGRRFPATVVGRDPKTDLAVLSIESSEALPFVAFGDSEATRVGDWVVAVGNPFGLGGSVTAGIVSARGRDIRSGPYDDYLQIDAPINRGNSGGPLFARDGRVVGVNSAIFSPSGGNVGIGFAIPAAMARPVVDQLIADGEVRRAWLGIQVQGLTPALAAGLALDAPRGALVAEVVPGSPAAEAGIAVGDVVTGFDGTEIDAMRDLPRLAAAAEPGAPVSVEIWRDGKARSLEIEPGRAPSGGHRAARLRGGEDGDDAHGEEEGLGMSLSPAPGGRPGVVVRSVEHDGNAARSGIRRGDVILRAGSRQASTPSDVRRALEEARREGREALALLVRRDGDARFVGVPTGDS